MNFYIPIDYPIQLYISQFEKPTNILNDYSIDHISRRLKIGERQENINYRKKECKPKKNRE